MAATRRILGGGTTSFKKVVEECWSKVAGYLDVGVTSAEMHFDKVFVSKKTPITLGGFVVVASYFGMKNFTSSQKIGPSHEESSLTHKELDATHKELDAIEERLEALSNRIDLFEEASTRRLKDLSSKFADNDMRLDDLRRGYKLV